MILGFISGISIGIIIGLSFRTIPSIKNDVTATCPEVKQVACKEPDTLVKAFEVCLQGKSKDQDKIDSLRDQLNYCDRDRADMRNSMDKCSYIPPD